MKKFLSVLMALAICLSLCGGAMAEGFPAKEITYLCGYGAGGSSDKAVRSGENHFRTGRFNTFFNRRTGDAVTIAEDSAFFAF